MVDINQWRASIGGWSCRCTSISWNVSNNKVKTNPTITDSVSILAGPATLSLVLVLVLLLVLSGDIELNPGPGSKPDAFDVFHFLKSHSSKWDEIGRDLKVDLNTRRKIEQGGQPTSTVERKLEEVIDHWIQSCCSELTWDHLIEVLRELQMVNIAEEIESCLLNDEKMKTKYNWKRVNDIQSVELEDSSSSSRDFNTDIHTDNSSSVTTTVVVNQTDLSSTSDHICQIPECVQRFKRHYKGYYVRIKTPAYHNKKPSPSITEFINLILVDQNRNKESKNDKIATLQNKMKGDTEKITNKKPTLSIDQIGSSGKSQVLVLIKGDPGIGKTTLAWELCKGWTEGRLLQTWDIVLLVQLRDKNIREANTLQSLIDPYNDPHMRGVYEYIQDNNGAGLMLIFDGFDELSDTQRQESSFFMRLLRGEMLSEASIILTTRPSAMKLIPEVFINNLDQHIEIHGFKEKAIHRYIECKFKDNSDILEAFKDYVSSHHFIFSLMYVPLHCALITDLYGYYYDRQREFAPKTLTELYSCLVHCLIWRNTGREIKSISDVSDDLKLKFIELAKIAAMGIENRQYVFDDIASVDEFGLLQRVEIANEDYGCSTVSCSFLHLTIQEYLAAYYWSTQKDVSTNKLFDSKAILPFKVNHLIKTKSRQKNRVSFHWPAVHFYSGLTGIEGALLEPIIDACRTEFERDNAMSITYNYLCLLFESTSGGNHANSNVISSAFATTCVTKSKINSGKEAYVTGYCIARANESVKWEIELDKSGLIKNLVHGIEHGKLANVKGSVIRKIDVINGSSDCDVSQFFNYLEKISGFLKNLKLMFHSDLRRFQRSQVTAIYSFDLVHVSYERKFGNRTNVLGTLLKILEHFKSLQTVSLLGSISRCITDTTIDEHGQVHLYYLDTTSYTKHCFPAFCLHVPSDVCKSLPDYHFIPYVAVQLHPASIHGASLLRFGFREYGYRLLPFRMMTFFNSAYNLLYHDSITDHQLPKQLFLCDQDHFCPHERVSFSTVTVHFYNCNEKKWITLKLIMENINTLRILVSPENIQLLMDILKKTTVFKLVYGDSDYLQPLLQLIRNDLQRSLNIPQRISKHKLAVILDVSRLASRHKSSANTKLPMAEMTEICNRNLIKCCVHCDLDHLHLVKQQCSIYKVISFSLSGIARCLNLDHFKILKTLTDFLFQQSTIKEFKLVNWKSQSSLKTWNSRYDVAKLIHDGLADNQGLKVVVFDNVRSELKLPCQGLIDHSSLKTLIIDDCSISLRMLIPIIRSAGRNLKHLVIRNHIHVGSNFRYQSMIFDHSDRESCHFSIDDYQVLLEMVNSSSIEVVAILMEKDHLVRQLLASFVPWLNTTNCMYKLILSYDISCWQLLHPIHLDEYQLIQNLREQFSLGDISQVGLKSYWEFDSYTKSLMISK